MKLKTLMTLGASLGCALPLHSHAADAADVTEIIVTGTRRSDVSAIDSAVPTDVVSADQLASSGSLSLVQSLRSLSPSISFAETGGVIGARLAQSVSLHGLPAGNTLVLVNGKRRTVTPKISFGTEWSRGQQPVDVNDIPQSAVQRVEILRDSASAQYGSDAIAGVVNIILRGNEPGGSVSTTFGQYYEGDGETKGIEGWYTLPIGQDGFINFSASGRTGERTDRDNLDILTYYFAGDPREATADKDYGFYGNPETEAANFSFNTEIPLSDAVTAYGFGTYSRREAIALYRITPRADGNVRARFPDGQMANPIYRFNNFDVTAGARWDAGDAGRFDFSVQYGDGENENLFKNAQAASFGVNTPTNFNLGTYFSRQRTVQLDYVKELNVGYASSPLTLSAGLGWRQEEFEIEAGEYASYANGGVTIADGPNVGRLPAPGSTDFAGLRPQDAGEFDRDITSFYVGLEQQFTEKFQAGISGRFEDYSDFGSTATGKVSVRYDFVPAFAVRASIGNAFKAPSMGQIGASSTTASWVYPTNGNPPYVATRGFYPVTSPVAQALGASELDPEESTNYSLGFVITPTENTSITIDGYQIDISDVILPIDTLLGTAVTNILAANGVTDVTGAAYFANQADTRARGVDVTARYSLRTQSAGAWDFSLAANYNDNEITRIKANPPELAGAGLTLVGRQSQGYLTSWTPKDKVIGTVRFTGGRFDVTASAIRYGEYKFTAAAPANDQTFDPQWVANLSVGVGITEHLRAIVGAVNLFDKYPDEPRASNRFRGMNNYDLQAPAGGNGGYYYLTLNASF
ncbi:TonB-dependent receptor plug domain-containing protein [Steroidobacter sp.]|uniref:TonB-dependent receptor plug domain-containing protein n=1 Tax=Steroidobacter sp. TaxID=1978227 RepID=UPI001A3EC966|nr:TonB-dependent receptor [Steroidobacter sp.]MBL8269260.1 TonB-dependent receptor [Steroidobacter sp.]